MRPKIWKLSVDEWQKPFAGEQPAELNAFHCLIPFVALLGIVLNFSITVHAFYHLFSFFFVSLYFAERLVLLAVCINN